LLSPHTGVLSVRRPKTVHAEKGWLLRRRRHLGSGAFRARRQFIARNPLAAAFGTAELVPFRVRSQDFFTHDFYAVTRTPWRSLSTAISQNFSSRSIPTARRPIAFAATSEDPTPQNGSSRIPPGGTEYSMMGVRMSTGFWVGCRASPWHDLQ